ncbi:family S53 protease-like protein [Mycena filopes]|nr:family S53 protease-like protein [Mycena filopes]
MGFSTLLAFLSIIAVSAGRMVVHESRASAPAGFTNKGAAPAADVLTLRVALAANNLAGLQQKLASVSTPGSAEFRQWLSKDDVKSFVAPSAETVAAFNAWATANELSPTVISPNGDWFSITLPVSKADSLFAAKFETFSHPDISSILVRTLSVSLPSELVGHVDVISPSTDFVDSDIRLAPSTSSSLPSRDTPPASCNTNAASGRITPVCLQDLYGIPATPATQSNNTNSIIVSGYVDEWAQAADLTTFFKAFRPDIASNTTFTTTVLDGGENPQGSGEAGVEANLDIQFSMGIATGVATEFLSVGGGGTIAEFAQSLLDTTTFLDGLDNPGTVLTTSYGTTESSFGASMAVKICNGYMALGARGISVIYASGDGGVRGNHDSASVCNINTFMPVFPAACPYVTAVGSTIGIPEVAVNFTGGGFSNLFPTPDYQTAAVSSFLATIPSTFRGTFNKTGRGYPDVALQGWNFDVVANGVTEAVSGTSASAPSFAGLIALINDQLIAAGKPVLGFLNPFIYASESAFTDITTGHNSGFTCPASSVAFDAAPGWDALTGVGTPLFDQLLAAALA